MAEITRDKRSYQDLRTKIYFLPAHALQGVINPDNRAYRVVGGASA